MVQLVRVVLYPLLKQREVHSGAAKYTFGAEAYPSLSFIYVNMHEYYAKIHMLAYPNKNSAAVPSDVCATTAKPFYHAH